MFQFLTCFVAILLLLSSIQAKPTTNADTAKLTLPWGTYVAEPPKSDSDTVSLTIVTIEQSNLFNLFGSY